MLDSEMSVLKASSPTVSCSLLQRKSCKVGASSPKPNCQSPVGEKMLRQATHLVRFVVVNHAVILGKVTYRHRMCLVQMITIKKRSGQGGMKGQCRTSGWCSPPSNISKQSVHIRPTSLLDDIGAYSVQYAPVSFAVLT
jgi:hypothetical protein